MRTRVALFLALVSLGVQSTVERPILFDSDRTGSAEIYALDPDDVVPPRQLTRMSATGGASSAASYLRARVGCSPVLVTSTGNPLTRLGTPGCAAR